MSRLRRNLTEIALGRPFQPFLSHMSYCSPATIFTSISFHLLSARREAMTQRDRYMARITILESLVERLRQKEHIEGEEIDRLLRLSRRPDENSPPGDLTPAVPWKDVVFGRSR